MSTTLNVKTKPVHPVLDLGEDGVAWAIEGSHLDDETALRSVIVHLWELQVLRDSLDWSDLTVGKARVSHRTGRWVDVSSQDDPEGDARWEDAGNGDPWTFIDA